MNFKLIYYNEGTLTKHVSILEYWTVYYGTSTMKDKTAVLHTYIK